MNPVFICFAIALVFSCIPSAPRYVETNSSESKSYVVYEDRSFSQNNQVWIPVLVLKNIQESEQYAIARELHINYPTVSFELYSKESLLQKMCSYHQKKIDFPTKEYDLFFLGIINKMFNKDSDELKWMFISTKYKAIELE
ncbi:MAG: hypothetical protein DKM50_02290 [Candidatus Margulisiibacteriota bacterium]|nr:MAG: hypothetical protein A2X43_06745 [Candidatus Margulisbacteria bacterium GWD2_39_127]OGI05283.1 MAG: hypothetical protein A2X42_03740 [Candidatus Margulisbacteria bacterium GWF2_38_17]OGI10858.1 MAG: hypothetical protein A2X41_05735 [Candidatus Margulisbacteria bacterium GWE2_39_32]PZM83545.1 MAG: hypothetical protein DKM50_02290 [Candidatus Margulisiibacteriota bacterium]HAR64277.1 hypothetical protein [Candidatus Margulisiibacteriota bacterium]